MSIKIKRDTSSWDGLLPIGIHIDGELVEEISPQEEKTVNLSKPDSELQVKNTLAAGNKIQVKDGDVVKLTRTWTHHVIVGILLVFIIIITLTEFPMVQTFLYLIGAAAIAYIIDNIILKSYRAEIVDKIDKAENIHDMKGMGEDK